MNCWALKTEKLLSTSTSQNSAPGYCGRVTKSEAPGHTILFKIITRIKLLFSNYLGRYSYSFRARQELISVTVASRSPKAGHNKAGRSDFRNQRFEPDTGKMRKMRKVPLTPEKQGSEEIPPSKNAENADTKTRKMRKMWMTGFNVTGFR